MPALNQPTILPTYSIADGDVVVGAGAQHVITEVGWLQSIYLTNALVLLEIETDGWQTHVIGIPGDNTPVWVYSDGTNLRINNGTGAGAHPYWQVVQWS